MIKGSHKPTFKWIPLLLVLISSAPSTDAQINSTVNKQRRAELAADRMMKRFYETLHFKTLWEEFYVTDRALRNLEVEAITFKLVMYRGEQLRYDRISMDARERAYIAQADFWSTLSAALFTSGNVPRTGTYARLYESITRRPKPYANSAELDKDFSNVMNELSDTNRKLVVPQNFGSQPYSEKVRKFSETNPADLERIRQVFAPAGLRPTVRIYVAQREMFHIFMIEEKDDFKILTILHRKRD